MIRIAELSDQDIGRPVYYYPPHAGAGAEYGKIKSWNKHFIFVVYHCDGNWDRFEEYTAAATDPDNLEFPDHVDRTRQIKRGIKK